MNDFEIVLKQILENNAIKQNGHFSESNSDKINLISKKNLYDIFSELNTAYESEELVVLKDYEIPEIVLRFLEYCSANSIYIGGDIYLLSIEELIRENSELAPGAFIIKYGFLTIAKTTGGNSICVDLNNLSSDDPRVLIADKSIFCDRTIYKFEKGRIMKEELSFATIDKYARVISERFSQFLRELAENEIADVESYLEK